MKKKQEMKIKRYRVGLGSQTEVSMTTAIFMEKCPDLEI